MTFLVDMAVVRNLMRSVRLGRDHCRCAANGQKSAKSVGIECFVAEYVLGRQANNQVFGLGRVMHLSAGVKQAQHVAEGINGNVNFGAQAPTRSSDCLLLNPLFRRPHVGAPGRSFHR